MTESQKIKAVRKVEELNAGGISIKEAAKKVGLSDATFYKYRKLANEIVSVTPVAEEKPVAAKTNGLAATLEKRMSKTVSDLDKELESVEIAVAQLEDRRAHIEGIVTSLNEIRNDLLELE